MRYAVALIIAGIFFMWWGRSGAAEADRPHVIWLFQKPTASEQPDQQRIFAISAPYSTKDDCLQAIRRVRIMAKGASVKCLPKEN